MNFNVMDNIEYQEIRRDHSAALKLFMCGREIVRYPADFISVVISSNKAAEGYIYGDDLSGGQSRKPDFKSEFFSRIARKIYFDSHVRDYCARISSDVPRIFAFSCFAFMDIVFWNDCASVEEVIKFHSFDVETSNPLLSSGIKKTGGYKDYARSRQLRSRAEENYKKGHFDSALTNFAEAVSLNPEDYTAYFQAALIFFYEKADMEKACSNLKTAVELSRNVSPRIFSYCHSLLSLIERLSSSRTEGAALLKRQKSAVTDSGDAAVARYALLQCAAAFPEEAGRQGISVEELAASLIAHEPFFALQIFLDPAMETVLIRISKVLEKMVAARTAECESLMSSIGMGIEFINTHERLFSDALRSRFNSVRKDFRVSMERSGSSALLDTLALLSNLTPINLETKALSVEIGIRIRADEIKTFADGLLDGYREELHSGIGAYSEAGRECEKLKSRLADFEKTYPLKISGPGLENGENIGVNWYEKSDFGSFKATAAAAVFVSVVLITLAFPLLGASYKGPLFVIANFVNLAALPLYALICGEIYKSFIEGKRKELKAAIGRYEFQLDVNSNVPEAKADSLKAKYSALISEKFGLTSSVSKLVFDAVAEGHPEKIRGLVVPKARTPGPLT